MSYEIIYGKQFVKLCKTGEVIPMVLGGSNNCFEIGLGGRTGRRSRSWSNIRYYNRKLKISEKPERILSKVDAELRRYIRKHRGDSDATPTHIRNHFGYYAAIVVGSGHCGGTSWDQYRSLFANGIKKALTIEALDKLGINLYFSTFTNSPDGMPASIPIKTERDYFTEIKKWREWQDATGKMLYLSFSPSNTDRVLERLRASRRKPPKVKTTVEQDHYFVLTNDQGNLLRYTSRGYRYSYSKTGGKRYRTEKDAEKYRQQLVKNRRHNADTWKVARIEGTASFTI